MAEYRKTPIVPLETERLLLRPIQASDAPRIQDLFPNPNMLRYMNASIPWPYPEDGAMTAVGKMLAAMESGEEFPWAILLRGREEEGLIGVIVLTPASDEDHRGFWLGEPFWGQGLMKEATVAVNDFAFDVLGMKELLLNNAQPNVASHRLKESAGAEIISVAEANYVGGTFPQVQWRLTADAWRANKKTNL
jgi:RimJ/RimL family protein N-acetyltransferase